MSKRPWYKRYGADFVHGTLGLSLEEKGAYSLCLDLMYDRGGPIPDDARWLAGICNVSVRKWHTLRDALIAAGKISAEEGFLTNSRAEREIANAGKNSDERAESGRKGGVKSAENRGQYSKNNGIAEAQLEHTRINQRLDTDREEPSGSLSETTPDVPGQRKTRGAYPPDFEAFWQGYPTDSNMSKKAAGGVWKRLPHEEREAAMRSLPAFRAYCSANVDYRPVHANRYLSQARYEGHLETAQKIQERVFVARGSPEWEAWQRVKKTQAVMSSEHRVEGWWFPSQWPQQEAA